MAPHHRPWLDAWFDSAYSDHGFWRSASPAEHFRTASTTTSELADLVARLLVEHPEVGTVVELGAGDGRLLAGLLRVRPELTLVGVDLRDRPAGCPAGVGWRRDLWDVRSAGWTSKEAELLLATLGGPTLLICAEWLDDLPCPVATRVDDGLRLVEVDPAGHERSGSPAGVEEAAWATRWSPWSRRLEIGTTRDRVWASLCERLRPHGGLVLLVDYGHLASSRPVGGSLAAYRLGHHVPPRPSADLNLTAAVAIDSLEAAGRRAGATTVLRAQQHQIVARSPPARPADTLADLVQRSHRAALGAPRVWGQQWWLLQQVVPG